MDENSNHNGGKRKELPVRDFTNFKPGQGNEQQAGPPVQQQTNGATVTNAPHGPPIYARLSLLAPIPLANGSQSHEIVIYRPTCRAMTEILDTVKQSVQAERFVEYCCRAVNGSGDPQSFPAREMNCVDQADLSSVIAAMSEEADNIIVEDTGDGVTSPIIYNLKTPIVIVRTNVPEHEWETVHQIEFLAKKVGDIAEFLDARGETREFHAFCRTFGKPLGLRFPLMSDGIVNQMDYADYLAIRRTILPKFVVSRNRWRKEPSRAG